jgi:hypothetical protein
MRRLVRLVGRGAAATLFAALALTVIFVPGAAAADSAATCTLDIALTLRPGLTLTPSRGAIVSDGAGTLGCVGLIDGHLVTGPGEFRVRGSYSGTVAAGTTAGEASYSVPTTAGPAGGTVAYSVVWLGIAGFITVEDDVYGNGAGPFVFLPNGDGLIRPVTSIRWVSQQITFGSGRPTSGG